VTTYYVGPGGNDGNAGTSWALRKLTLNGAEDIPVAAGDVVYVGPGVYRETLTCDVSGGNTYTTGTVTVTQASDQVTGAGTAWVANVAAGYWFHVRRYLYNTDGVTNGTSTFTSAAGNFHANLIGMPIQINTRGAYTISAVVGATSLTLADPNGLGWPAAAGGLTYSCMTGEGHYEIESVDDNTTITLCQPWQGPTHSGLAYITFNAITYIADPTGENTDGVGGVVRLTGSDNDQTVNRNYGIDNSAGRDYRVFRGLRVDGTASYGYYGNGADHVVIEDCPFVEQGAASWSNYLATSLAHTVRRCYFLPRYSSGWFVGSADDTGHVFENNVFLGSTYKSLEIRSAGGVTVRNCLFKSGHRFGGIASGSVATTGQTWWVINSVFIGNEIGLGGAALGQITENYNTFYQNNTDRQNTATGANSVQYMALFGAPLLYAGADELSGFKIPWRFGQLSQWSAIRAIAGWDERNTDTYGIRRPATAAKCSWGPVQYHDVERETGTIYAGTASMKFNDAGSHQVWVPQNGTVITVSVYVYREANYAGNLPQMVIKQPGQADRVTTDAGAAGGWNLLTDTFTPAALPDYVVVELQSQNTAAAGNYATYFDAFRVAEA